MSTKLNMSKINHEELSVWNEMQMALNEHKSYFARKPFYPHNMDSWEKEHKDLEHRYHEKLKNMISVRVKFEMAEIQLENEMEAVQTLIMMKNSEEKPVKRIAKKEKVAASTPVLRRSSRINA